MNELIKLNKKIIKCNKCSRLVNFRKKYQKKKGNNIFMKLTGVSQFQVLEILSQKYY